MGTIYVSKRGPKGRFVKSDTPTRLLKAYLEKTSPGGAYTSPQSSKFVITTKGRAGQFRRVYLTPIETKAIGALVR